MKKYFCNVFHSFGTKRVKKESVLLACAKETLEVKHILKGRNQQIKTLKRR